MGVYSEPGRGYKYDFVLKKQRHTSRYFKTKTEAKRAEAARREELNRPVQKLGETQTDMAFLDLVNYKLDNVKAYNSKSHYEEFVYAARRWHALWGKLSCGEITQRIIEKFVLERSEVSPYTANKEIRYLKATFNFGIKKGMITTNPVMGIDMMPEDKKRKHIPSFQDIAKVIAEANQDTRDYLWTIRDTMGRVSEINALKWEDVDLRQKTVTLYTRKKRGGHRTPRVIPLTDLLVDILSRRSKDPDEKKPWVFWHRYWDRKQKRWIEGPYHNRHKLMRTLCDRAGVAPFGFHALRHAGASLLDQKRIPLGTIQKILGHENRQTTEIYLHSMGDSERAAMAAFERATGGNTMAREAAAREKPHSNSHSERAGSHGLRLVKG